MKAETATVLPFTVLFTDTPVTITLVLIHGIPEVSAQPPAGFSLATSPEAVLWLSGLVSQVARRQIFSFAFYFILWSFPEWPRGFG